MNPSDILNNLLGYFQNTPVQRQGNGLVASEYANPIAVKSPSNYIPQQPSTPSSKRPFTDFAVKDRPQFPSEYRDYLSQAEEKYKVNPLILASLAAQETGGYNYQPVVGSSGERGITQIIPNIWGQSAGYENTPQGYEDYGLKLESDPGYALMEAARILSLLRQSYPGFELAAYNAGPNYNPGLSYQESILDRIAR